MFIISTICIALLPQRKQWIVNLTLRKFKDQSSKTYKILHRFTNALWSLFANLYCSIQILSGKIVVLKSSSTFRKDLYTSSLFISLFLFNKTNQTHEFPKFYFVKKLYIFRAFPLPIIRSYLLYIRRWYIPCKFDDSYPAGSGWNLTLPETCRLFLTK